MRELSQTKGAKRIRKWRAANPERVAELQRKWNKANPEKVAEQHRRYRLANPKKVAEQHRRYREANREKIAEHSRKWQLAHPEYLGAYRQSPVGQAYLKAYCQSPEGKATHQRAAVARRARLEAIVNTLTDEEWQAILEVHDFRCAYCGCSLLDLFKPPTRDHIIPISKGGNNTKENIVPSCRSCNSKKGTGEIKT